ncbi:hypothetical protein [Rathayibacter soli]|uniref:hypothetical protein n=1 Tax=Rathayibacter soli TaxID=3144168 RepID=UPI0027E5531B|nr:hypothetical protein [Glaciibacter superstes]
MTIVAARADGVMPLTGVAGAPRRIWNVVRLQFANRWNMLAIPWLIIAFVFLVNYAIWAIITAASNGEASLDGTQYSGSTLWLFAYLMIAAIQAMTLTFPFALGFSVTRRDYYLGTTLAFVVQSAAFTATYVILSYIEDWTNGWGLGGHMFSAIYFGQGPLAQRIFTVFATFLICFAIGLFAATVFVRWKSNGLILAGACLTIVLLAGAALITFTQSWLSVWAWFGDVGSTGVVAWILVPAALLGVAGFYILRRATPKS